MPVAHADQVEFNGAFLPAGSRSLDLVAYQNGNPVLPGTYRADIALNGQLKNRQDIKIHANDDGSHPVVCVSRRLLELLGVDMARLSPEATALLEAGNCADLSKLIENATAKFVPESQQVDISIPQISLRRDARGYVSPELWDSGVTSGMLGYNFNSNHNKSGDSAFNSAYLGLDGGFNLGAWRLRHKGALSWQQAGGSRYQVLDTYLRRDVTSLKSQLTLGDSNTSGEIFDTQSFRGVQLASDDRMLPNSLRGYAPVVRGIARTSARVTIRQAGNILLETTVAPGAFVIDDLYATGYGGDLNVTVSEADGSEQRFVVPYAAVTQLLRPGTLRFGATAGVTRNNHLSQQAGFLQGTVQYGLNNSLTGYGGVQASADYLSLLGGMAFATPIGAMSVDLSHAQTDLDAEKAKGQSMRMSYSKNILSTGSNFSMAAYRFSTSGYLDFANAMQALDTERQGYPTTMLDRPRNRLSLTADQSLGEWGNVSISGYTQNYWNREGQDLQYQLSYNKRVGRISYGISANRGRTSSGGMENRLLLSVNLPLGSSASVDMPYMSAQLERNADGRYSQLATVSGTAGEERQFGYGASVSRDGSSGSSSGTLSGQYTGARTFVGASVGRGKDYTSASFNMSGSVVAHPGGVTLSPHRGDTMAVVHAPGAAGATVAGYPGLRLDASGNAVVPYLRPYELNEVAIDPVGSSMDVEMRETSQQVAPRDGAVVFLKYSTSTGRAVLFQVRLAGGDVLPFGATVKDEQGQSVGMVGQNGQLYARLQETSRQLSISWGGRAHERCSLPVPASLMQGEGGQLQQAEAVCVPELINAKAPPAEERSADLQGGTYSVDIFVNGQRMERREVAFLPVAGGQDASPCMSTVDLQAYGVQLSKEQLLQPCQLVLQSIPGASWSHEAAVQRLDLQVPPAFMAALVPRQDLQVAAARKYEETALKINQKRKP
ncbi:fimbria/pilus outer membrane usher protein [Janthinobacterium sp. BJB401]|uniref:fimbria/pilus outer membrane usher protein n=1 Tax=Janthinobacterium sp. BJB401 TaxID=2745934 RepID=UPI00159593AA|nr:fimbria/pilus outer membrane usher protein [Janthinobacterium sp. BJB401]NVI82504.1 fimbria/pilus outer membrane usher protein [Janthinobacterium sp. BJB401]